MKLFLCPMCADIMAMLVKDWRSCRCGESAGRYLEDGDFVEVSGKAIPIGILNSTVLAAVRNWGKDNPSLVDLDIKAFLFKKDYFKIKRVKHGR